MTELTPRFRIPSQLSPPEDGTARLSDLGSTRLRVAVLVPCHNEERTVAKVVADFRRALPESAVYVYDNASSDRTAELARGAGAIVCSEPLRGKGNVVRRMFADIEADIYVLADGDDTYDAAAAPRLVQRLIENRLDMVNAARSAEETAAYRLGHRFGNRLFSALVARLFGNRFADILSGFRVLSRRFVKSFPSQVRGFDIETEMTVHALEMRMPVDEVAAVYKQRPLGSTSKLSTVRDGIKIMWRIGNLIREERPPPFFAGIGAALALLSIALAYPLFVTFLETGLVPRIPTAILCVGLMLLAFLSATCGLILDTVTRGRREMKRMFYLAQPAPPARGGERQW